MSCQPPPLQLVPNEWEALLHNAADELDFPSLAQLLIAI